MDGFFDSQLILLRGVGPIIQGNLPTSLELNDSDYDYKLGLRSFQTYNSFPNIEVGKNNQLAIKPGKNAELITFKLPTGAYEIDTIYRALIYQLRIKGYKDSDDNFKLIADSTTFKSIITLKKDWTISFAVPNSLNTILGFNATDILEGESINISPNIVQIQNFNSLLFLCNVTDQSIVNDKYMPCLYHYSKNTAPGFNIVVVPNEILYKSITTNILQHIKVWFVDENGHLVNFNSELLTVELQLVRKLKSTKKRKLNY